MTDKPFERIICVDFDGVIHSYSSGWQGVDVIPDKPVPEALVWLHSLVEADGFKPVIYSSRSKDPKGIEAMKAWFHRYAPFLDGELEFPTEKPSAFLTIDDRAVCFRGTFPTQMAMKNFCAWNKIETLDQARAEAQRLYGPRADACINEIRGVNVHCIVQFSDDPANQGLWGNGRWWSEAFDAIAERVRGGEPTALWQLGMNDE